MTTKRKRIVRPPRILRDKKGFYVVIRRKKLYLDLRYPKEKDVYQEAAIKKRRSYAKRRPVPTSLIDSINAALDARDGSVHAANSLQQWFDYQQGRLRMRHEKASEDRDNDLRIKSRQLINVTEEARNAKSQLAANRAAELRSRLDRAHVTELKAFLRDLPVGSAARKGYSALNKAALIQRIVLGDLIDDFLDFTPRVANLVVNTSFTDPAKPAKTAKTAKIVKPATASSGAASFGAAPDDSDDGDDGDDGESDGGDDDDNDDGDEKDDQAGGGDGELPLYSTQIDAMMKLHGKSWLGVIAADQIPTLAAKFLSNCNESPALDSAAIMNLDSSGQPGSHWVAIYISPDRSKSIEYMDSFGNEPPQGTVQELTRLVEMLEAPYLLRFKINRVKYQTNDSVLCGWHAMRFITDRLAGKPWKHVTVDNSERGEAALERWRDKRYGYM